MSAATAQTHAPTANARAESTSMTDQAATTASGAAASALSAAQPAINKVRSIIKEKPMASALAAGVFGLAILNSLRGRSSTAKPARA